MLHPGPLAAAAALDAAVEPGASPALDLAAAAADPRHAFLRAAWYDAASGGRCRTLVARRSGSGEIVAALPLESRRLGPFRIRQVPGSYWPFRSFPIARDAAEEELAAWLAAPASRRALGRFWRLGAIPADDPALPPLAKAAKASGWTVLARSLGTSWTLDLGRLAAAGPWPSIRTRHKLRWLERRLAAAGALRVEHVSGDGWSRAAFDALAAVEAESWVGRAVGADAKFLDPRRRGAWERAAGDPEIASRLGCHILRIGEVPAAFAFTLDDGAGTRHVIANSYAERFAAGSPGRVLLYRAFAAAAESGAARIGWGVGDAGYKRAMGAEPGAEMMDLLLVRAKASAALARLAWRSR